MKNNNEKKNICIIGAGIAGLAAGVLLTKRGHSVTIFEKEGIIGGRALSLKGDSLALEQYKHLLSSFNMKIAFSQPSLEDIFKKQMLKGYSLDLGFHVIGGGVTHTLNEVISNEKQVEMLGTPLAYIAREGFDYPFLSFGDKLKMAPRILRLLLASENTMKKLDAVSMAETIKKYGRGKMKLVLEIFPRVITTVNDLHRISSGETFRAQKNLLKGPAPIVYPQYGLGMISKMLSDAFTQHGGTIRLSSHVQKILVEDNCATGVVVNGKEHLFDEVVSNVPVQRLFALVDKQHFPSDYVEGVQYLEGTGSLCGYYALKQVDERLLGKSFLFIARNAGVEGTDAVGMIDFMTALPESGLAPSDHFLIQSYIICTPEEARDSKMLEKLKTIMDNQLEHLMPDFHSQLNWALYPAIWQLDGVAKTIDNIKPDIQSPVEHLYLIGDCVKAPGVGFNCALNSARILDTLL